MPGTIEALTIALGFIVPGAIYQWAYERQVGGVWTHGLGDRVLRFLRTSAILNLVFSPLIIWTAIRLGDPITFPDGDWPLYFLVLAFVLAISIAGTAHGYLATSQWLDKMPFISEPRAPTGWDHLFSRGRAGWVRAQLKHDGTWVGGIYDAPPEHPLGRGLTAAHPFERDILLINRIDVDPHTGEWPHHGEDEPGALLLRWDELIQLEFTPFAIGKQPDSHAKETT